MAPIARPHRETCGLAPREKNEETEAAREMADQMGNLALPADFDSLGPVAKVRKLSDAPGSSETVIVSLNAGAQMNFIRHVQDSLSSAASGIQCYGSFCDLLGAPYFPPSSDVALRWSAVFIQGRTYGMYVSHLTKAFQMLEHGMEWM